MFNNKAYLKIKNVLPENHSKNCSFPACLVFLYNKVFFQPWFCQEIKIALEENAFYFSNLSQRSSIKP
jgi:hypothetical protein